MAVATPAQIARIRQALKDFDLKRLFIDELGWNRYKVSPLSVAVNGATFTLQPVAEKRGAAVFECGPDGQGHMPDYATRKQIEREVTKSAHEHLIVYLDGARTTQRWQWVKRQPGKPTAYREHAYYRGQSGEALVQRLPQLSVDLTQEEDLTLPEVTGRMSQAFDVDRVTKRFYERFKTEHAAFLKAIAGIPGEGEREWYASLMLNRLMFVYFIQKKGFLDSDLDYLRRRMQAIQQRQGADRFHTFYQYFLLSLFHEGLATRPEERKPDLEALIGQVPYLNGGLFEVHQIEQTNPHIQIPDAAFERIFDFFDAYQWHLDERPMRADNEINPDVLGYIFEKYINQKQMGAYYTKEDITEYIAKNTVIPFLFEAAEPQCKVAFAPDGEVWRLLRDDPDRYIYDAVRKGTDLQLPTDIAAGVSDVSKRGGWNRPADPEHALPTETWREHVARRTRYEEVRAKLASGEVTSINDLITYNLDIRRFAQDVIERCEGAELLRAFWRAIAGKVAERSNEQTELGITILDPACGSGAFLFAALTVLEPLYEACLDRMRAFVADFDSRNETRRGPDFRRILERAQLHPNPRYFILKSIIVNNLYGVDIMDEACEIAKLRLFLKLVSQVDDVRQLEPLPDIDFNIRAGNTLVGFATLDDVMHAITTGENGQIRLPSQEDQDTIRRINERAEVAGRAFERFQEMQTTYGMENSNFTEAKRDLRSRLDALNNELNHYLAREYGIDLQQTGEVVAWHASHRPFHWCVEFYGIMHHHDGFDAIIGNPPYVEYKNVRHEYTIKHYATEDCGDLYAYFMERSTNLVRRTGAIGMIVPVSVVSTDGFSTLRSHLLRPDWQCWCANFAERPSKLFTGVEKRLSIWVMRSTSGVGGPFVSSYHRWFSEERGLLFFRIAYVNIDSAVSLVGTAVPKIASSTEVRILKKIGEQRQLASYFVRSSSHLIYYTRKVRYFVQFFDFIPRIINSRGEQIEPSELKEICLHTSESRDLALGILNSNLFFLFFNAYSDVRNVNRREIEAFRCSIDVVLPLIVREIGELSRQLMVDFSANSSYLTNNYGRYGVLNIQTFQPRLSKSIIDDIDRVLAKHYGFSGEELDFIINYDIKYRMGQDTVDDAEEE